MMSEIIPFLSIPLKMIFSCPKSLPFFAQE